jgi:hypothetical protein
VSVTCLPESETELTRPRRAPRRTIPRPVRRAREHRAVVDAPHLRAGEDRFAQGR